MRSLFNVNKKVYCLDSNIFIEGWNKYYSPKRTKNYWEILDDLARGGQIFSPVEVKREIDKKDDELKKWFASRKYFFRDPDHKVTEKVAEILKIFPNLVDNIKGRSLADPWVIAQAAVEGAIVVSKEEVGVGKNVRIPNVCKYLKINCIDDFTFLDEIGVVFKAGSV